MSGLSLLSGILAPASLAAVVVSYCIGSIPWAYLIVKGVMREDITQHGTGNVGAMNVRRTTGSWAWFAVAMVADGLKGLVPTLAAKGLWLGFTPAAIATPYGIAVHATGAAQPAGFLAGVDAWWNAPQALPMAALIGAVLGHNYSLWLAIHNRRFGQTGKGLATGAGALLAYDWRYFAVVLCVGLVTIALTRYMMAGQVAAAVSLPVTALALRSPDWAFALLMAGVVYAAHHRRFMGLLRGEEPKAYTRDRMGPKG